MELHKDLQERSRWAIHDTQWLFTSQL